MTQRVPASSLRSKVYFRVELPEGMTLNSLMPHGPKVRKWTPTPEMAEMLRVNKTTKEWLSRATAEELAPYAGQWIAARGNRVLASAVTREEIESLISAEDRSTVIVHKIENRWMIR